MARVPGAIVVALLYAPPSRGAPPALLDNLGSHHHPVTASSPVAQSYFDQGLRLVYGFRPDEAERAFREAANRDPRCAMAWWGVALALAPSIDRPPDLERTREAAEAIEKARSLTRYASEAERGYIEALAKRYSPAPVVDGTAPPDREYARAMGEHSRRYPDDLDGATLYAASLMDLRPWKLWTLRGKPAEGTEEIVSILEAVLRRDPDHPGANHYFIHAVEASPHPERALPSAKRLETLMPGAGHLVHLPAHVYMRTGDYAAATRASQAAAQVHDPHRDPTRPRGRDATLDASRNLHFLAASAMMQGRLSLAKAAADRAAAEAAPLADKLQEAERLTPLPYFVSLRFQRWDEILSYPEPGPDLPTTKALWRFVRGVAFAAKADLVSADAERTAFEAARALAPPGDVFGRNASKYVLRVASRVLTARVAAAKHDRNGTLHWWMKSVEAQEELAFDQPPAWYYPVRESLGAEMLRGGDVQQAEAVFRADLARNPRNPRSLFGLRAALEAQGKAAEAKRVDEELQAAWKNAEVRLRIEDL